MVRAIGPRGVEVIAGVLERTSDTPHIAARTPANQSYLPSLVGIAFDHNGNLYLVLAELVLKLPVGATGRITGSEAAVKVAGGGLLTDTRPHPTEALLIGAAAVAFDKLGAMFIAHRHRVIRVDPGAGGFDGVDTNNEIIDRTETTTRVAGRTTRENEGAGFTEDGVPAAASALAHPMGISFDRFGNLLIADTCNHRIRKVFAVDGKIDGAPDEIITTVAGRGAGGQSLNKTNGCVHSITDGISRAGGFNENEKANSHPPAIDADLDMPRSVVEDGAGNLLIADSRNNRVRRVAAGDDGEVTGFARGGGNDPGETIDTVAGCGPPRSLNDGAEFENCGGTRQEIRMPYGIARAECPETNAFLSEWVPGGAVALLRNLPECPEMDLELAEHRGCARSRNRRQRPGVLNRREK